MDHCLLLLSVLLLATIGIESSGPRMECPAPIWPTLSSACHVTVCKNDSDCHTGTLCCNNGCRMTCLTPLDPPSAFDWTEETPEVKLIAERKHEAQEGPGESIALKGGCILTSIQYSTLEDFTHNTHINHCFCNHGGIFCEVAK